MTPDEIRIELVKNREHTNMSKIARDMGVSQTAVQRVIERNSVSRRIMIAVAAAIKQSPSDVFPEHRFES